LANVIVADLDIAVALINPQTLKTVTDGKSANVICVNIWKFQMKNGLNEDAKPGVLADVLSSRETGIAPLIG
jgi:hypothetical protein